MGGGEYDNRRHVIQLQRGTEASDWRRGTGKGSRRPPGQVVGRRPPVRRPSPTTVRHGQVETEAGSERQTGVARPLIGEPHVPPGRTGVRSPLSCRNPCVGPRNTVRGRPRPQPPLDLRPHPWSRPHSIRDFPPSERTHYPSTFGSAAPNSLKSLALFPLLPPLLWTLLDLDGGREGGNTSNVSEVSVVSTHV